VLCCGSVVLLHVERPAQGITPFKVEGQAGGSAAAAVAAAAADETFLVPVLASGPAHAAAGSSRCHERCLRVWSAAAAAAAAELALWQHDTTPAAWHDAATGDPTPLLVHVCAGCALQVGLHDVVLHEQRRGLASLFSLYCILLWQLRVLPGVLQRQVEQAG
jgi:hypothetical protein